MANGDIAAGIGWTTYASSQSASLGYDDVNYALDRAADLYTTQRDVILPAINQPIFSVIGATGSTQNIGSGTWSVPTSPAWATPNINDGFTSWNSGQLTVKKAGLYTFGAYVEWDADQGGGIYRTGVRVQKNSLAVSDAATLARGYGFGFSAVLPKRHARLVAGDVITLMVQQNNNQGAILKMPQGPLNLSLNVEWVRA